MSTPVALSIFVVGCDRSGTTLLRLMLTCHPDLAIPPESLFARNLYPKWASIRLTQAGQIDALCNDLYKDEKFSEWKLDRSLLQQTLREELPLNYASFVATVHRTYARQHQPSASRWGDKNPAYVMHLGWLWHLFPDAQVVHIVRDGRAVFNSFRTSNLRAGYPIWPESAVKAARRWTSRLASAKRYRANSSYMEVHYEKLVRSPETELRRLCSFLNLVYDPAMLDFARVNRQTELVPKHRLAWHDATLRTLQTARISAWQQELDPADIARFELMAGHNLLQYGYPLQVSKLGRFRLVNRVTVFWARLVNRTRRVINA
jgi:hypothetical protein